jgi:hypothetical protein
MDVAERIIDGHPEATKVGDIPGRDAQILRLGDPKNQEVSRFKRSPLPTRFRLQNGTTERRITVQRQHVAVGRRQLGKPFLKEGALLPCRKSLNPRPNLIDSDGRQDDGGKLAEPANYLGVRIRSCRFEMTFVSSR